MARSRKLARHSTNLFQRFTLKPASAGFACIDSQLKKKKKKRKKKKGKERKKKKREVISTTLKELTSRRTIV